VSDERDSAGSAGAGDDTSTTGDGRGQTAVVTRPLRPTGKRSRQGINSVATQAAPEDAASKNGSGTAAKTAKTSGPSRNPLLFVVNYLKQVVAELRKVIWPNRKQMVSYTTVVLVFLAFMVALIGVIDLGLARLMVMVFG
jgi:preprotein translocase subunit SecE